MNLWYTREASSPPGLYILVILLSVAGYRFLGWWSHQDDTRNPPTLWWWGNLYIERWVVVGERTKRTQSESIRRIGTLSTGWWYPPSWVKNILSSQFTLRPAIGKKIWDLPLFFSFETYSPWRKVSKKQMQHSDFTNSVLLKMLIKGVQNVYIAWEHGQINVVTFFKGSTGSSPLMMS